MTPQAWISFAIMCLGPLVGYIAHVVIMGDQNSFLGPVVFISWSGFFVVRALSCCDWE